MNLRRLGASGHGTLGDITTQGRSRLSTLNFQLQNGGVGNMGAPLDHSQGERLEAELYGELEIEANEESFVGRMY